MREEIGRYDRFWRDYAECYVSVSIFVEDGIFQRETDVKFCEESYENRICFKKRLGEFLLGDERFFVGTDDMFVYRVVRECCGKSVEEAKEIARRYAGKRYERKAKEEEGQAKWEALRKKFSGYVIGLDHEADVFDAGFSVRVLFRSSSSFAERRAFLKENRIEFVRWVVHECGNDYWIKKRIGDIRFYKPVEMVALRAPEVEVKFEVKREVVA